jgi:hypothetical protein
MWSDRSGSGQAGLYHGSLLTVASARDWHLRHPSPSRKIAIVVVHRTVLPNLTATTYSPQKKKTKKKGGGEWERKMAS